tara:strand:+ start:958 stop:1662 length:705 start_codon:yes stop_codon:yes gene_type:complete
MQNMLVFHNGSNTSYANYAGNLSSISSATTAITLRFLGQGAAVTATSTDAVVLTVLAGKEEYVMEQLSAAIANARAGMTVVADDQNGSYLLPEITAVDSISVDTGAGTFKNVIVGAFASNDIAITNAQSGSLVTIPTTGAASTITLPTSPVDGFNAKFVAEADNGAHAITIAGAFEGIVGLAGVAGNTLDNTTNVVIAASKFKIGDFIEVVYSGSAGGYKISGSFITAGAIAAN